MKKTSKETTRVVFLALMWASGASGCGNNDAVIRSRSSGVGGYDGGSTSSNSTGGDSTGTGSSTGGGNTGTGNSTGAGEGGTAGCSGECVPSAPLEWLGPALLWIGKPGEAPKCPSSAPIEGSQAFADLDAANHCGTCKCDAPHGSCSLPTTLTAHSAACPGNGAGVTHTPFNPAAGWNGSCDSSGAIAANQKCNGENCVQSLTIGPVTITEEPCGVSTETVPADPAPIWGTAAQSCRGVAYGPCAAPGDACVPAVEPGFAQCIERDGDRDCPDLYPVKHLFYESLDDTRTCTPCACGAPAGSTCTAVVTAFKDGACQSLAVAAVVDAIGSACFDIAPSGSALGSKLAQEPVYTRGTCQASGGQPMGEAVGVNPLTYCCLP